MHADDAYFITVVSLDIVIDATWGDASKASTRQLWMNAIRERFVLAFLAGPPCETWSRVRSVNSASEEQQAEQPQQHLPRVLRDEDYLWGYNCLAIREIKQVNIGNCLLCFSLEALMETAMAGSVGMLEHPAEPTDLEGSASIWKLPIVQVLQMLPPSAETDICTRPHGIQITQTYGTHVREPAGHDVLPAQVQSS